MVLQPNRIKKEIEKMSKNPVPGIMATYHKENPRYFDIVLNGPKGSKHYYDPSFHLRFSFKPHIPGVM
jgi:ubiquitin-conjugating enzyme E2 N